MSDATLTLKKHNGGWIATYEGLLNLFTAYHACPGDAIRKLADENFSPDTSTFRAMNWYAHKVTFGNHIYIPDAVLGSMRVIANAWYTETH